MLSLSQQRPAGNKGHSPAGGWERVFRRRNNAVVVTDKQTDDDKPAGQTLGWWGGKHRWRDTNRGLQPRTGFQEKGTPDRGGVVGRSTFWAQGTARVKTQRWKREDAFEEPKRCSV